jgi:hypothetical protein
MVSVRTPAHEYRIARRLPILPTVLTLAEHDVDAIVVDGTPLLDIKPYVARFDPREGARCGRTDEVDARTFPERGSREGPRLPDPESASQASPAVRSADRTSGPVRAVGPSRPSHARDAAAGLSQSLSAPRQATSKLLDLRQT